MTDETAYGFTEDEVLDVARGHASADLTRRVEAAAAEHPGLAAELALLRGLKPALAEMTGDLNAPDALSWRRLEADIQREMRPEPSAKPSVAPIWRIAALVLGVLALGQGAYLISGGSLGAPLYQTATDGVAQHVLAISFAPEATAEEVNAVLRAAGARVIDGPGASGLFRVSFASGTALEDGRAILESSAAIGMVLDE